MSKTEKPLFDELDVETKATKPTFEKGKELYLGGTVNKIDREKTTLQGRLTVGEKTFYPEIIVKFDRFIATCNCNEPDSPICSHVVALGLAHVYGIAAPSSIETKSDNTYIEQFLYRIRDLFSKNDTETTMAPGFMLDINPKNETFSLFFYNKIDNAIIAQPEEQYHRILNSPTLTKIEKSLINFFVQRDYWSFFSPLNYIPTNKGLAEILTLFSEVVIIDPKTSNHYNLAAVPLQLQFSIDFNEPQLNVASTFALGSKSIPMSETLYIDGIKCFLYWNNYFFPVQDDIYKEFLPLLSRNPNLSLIGDAIPIFLGDVLPLIPENQINILKTPAVDSIEIISLQPDVQLNISETKEKLIAELNFHYQETTIKDSLLSSNKYYYTYESSRHIYIKKDPFAEIHAENILVQNGFIKTNNTFFTEGVKALDFLYSIVPNLPSSFYVHGTSELEKYLIHEEPVRMFLLLSKLEEKISITQEFRHLEKTLPAKTILTQISSRNPFILLTDKKYGHLPVDETNLFNEVLREIPHTRVNEETITASSLYIGLIINNFKDLIIYQDDPEAFFTQVEDINHLAKELPAQGLKAELRGYQEEGFGWLMFLNKNHWNGILADDMGLGKTLQTLTLLLKLSPQAKQPSLIVLPTSVMFNWERETLKFTPGLKTVKYYGPDREVTLAKLNQYDLVFTSYGTIRRDIEILKKYKFHYVILDEAQNIKNHLSQTATAVKQLTSEYKLALTGTPIENKLSELWSIFDFLLPGFLGSHEKFERQYEQFSSEFSSSAITELKNKISPFLLRRTKQEVASDLPAKIEEHFFCQMDDQFQAAYKQFRTAIRNDIFAKIAKDGINKHRLDIFTAMLRLRQFCCHPRLVKDLHHSYLNTSPKFEAFKSMIEEIIEENHKVLVFSQFTEMLAIIQSWLNTKGIKYAYLDGSTRDRGKVVDSFNNEPERRIFLISLKAGGTGLNLTSADYVLHYDPWWNPAVEAQATDRAHRIGQTRNVFAYKFITKDSIEEKILALQEQKTELYQAILSGQEKIFDRLQKDELELLFS